MIKKARKLRKRKRKAEMYDEFEKMVEKHKKRMNRP